MFTNAHGTLRIVSLFGGSKISEVLEAWLSVQRNWLYLQPIFESPDINKQVLYSRGHSGLLREADGSEPYNFEGMITPPGIGISVDIQNCSDLEAFVPKTRLQVRKGIYAVKTDTLMILTVS